MNTNPITIVREIAGDTITLKIEYDAKCAGWIVFTPDDDSMYSDPYPTLTEALGDGVVRFFDTIESFTDEEPQA